MTSFISEQFLLIAQNFSALAQQADKVSEIAQLCTEAIKRGHKIMFCGNGGSAADSQHLAAELVGRYKLERPALNAIALTVDTSILTAVGNDYGYDQVFARQVEGIGRQGDVLMVSPQVATVRTSFSLCNKLTAWASQPLRLLVQVEVR